MLLIDFLARHSCDCTHLSGGVILRGQETIIWDRKEVYFFSCVVSSNLDIGICFLKFEYLHVVCTSGLSHNKLMEFCGGFPMPGMGQRSFSE